MLTMVIEEGQPFSKLKARFRHLARTRLVSSSQSRSNPIVKSKTLLISPRRDGYRTSIRLVRSLPPSTISRPEQRDLWDERDRNA
jgi:hypothetical protein